MKDNATIRYLAAALLVALTTGCATRGDVDELKSAINEVQSTSQQALDNSLVAKQMASDTQLEIAELRELTKATNALAVQNDLTMKKMFTKSQLK